MRELFTLFRTRKVERHRALQWLIVELAQYADPKWDDELAARALHDDRLRTEGCGRDTFWFDQVVQYLQRAHTLGLDNPLGRQALMKGWAAYLGLVESAGRVYGKPPLAGVPSGTLRGTSAPH